MTTLTELHSAKAIGLFSWLIPISYLIHIAEELWGGEGYSAYIYRLRGVHMSPTRFLVAQAIGFGLLTLGIILSRKLGFPAMMIMILAVTLMGNGVTHSVNAISMAGYNPGLLSAVLIWIPMGIFVLVRFKSAVSRAKYWIALAIGIGINIVVGVITMKGGRIG